VPRILFLVLAALAAPLAAEEVVLDTGGGRLHGTLELPATVAPWPCVVLIAGSGPTDRDGNQPGLRNDSLKQLGAALAAKGFCVLRPDKRGVGASAGAAPKESELRFEHYVADAADWVAHLRKNVRVGRVALLGHSEGALVALLAAKRGGVEAFVSVAGAGQPAADVLRWQAQVLPRGLRKTNDAIVRELAAGRTVADVPRELFALYRPSVQPYLISWLRYDPAVEIAGVKVPVLVLHGTSDLQVPSADARVLARALPGARLELIEDMNHVLKRAATPAEQNRAYTDPSTPVDPRAVDLIAEFLRP
jgi:hypothetical protein